MRFFTKRWLTADGRPTGYSGLYGEGAEDYLPKPPGEGYWSEPIERNESQITTEDRRIMGEANAGLTQVSVSFDEIEGERP